ncbi:MULTISPECIES: FAD-binding oxidoreductase [unclassified Novosphingobium]|uniref:NAD(P)/FAD-dependent oxidoreductase n=1 Tax=unclassified Novosphingobium TaxID=2644732 RepID=UPI000D46AE0A|nr:MULTISPECIES: FAD-binding oxidoreductase [unclassified Novosphingobium]PTR05750.1 D-amino-acid dehydrogenase [Novosphingobium sp. GV055]PUA94352.1 D-amino-acid dehydrogenase [Novosphingobium sp. GV061]PUB12500.1 D-amino-acid dehydrogenase [Novosphingobium sp. GV079]PUB37292.1 D-amino-acid dehydrogenase [Novosphingobium sp. GV027]
MAVIGIVGGGVVGLCAGIALVDAGHSVTIIDDDRLGQAASWGNAGHIATEQVEPLASPATIRALPGRLFSRGGPLAFPPDAIGRWLPFGLRLMAAARPARFHAGCAAMAPLMAQALPAWRDLVARLGVPDLLREEGHLVAWHDAHAAAAGRAAWQAAQTGTARVARATYEDIARLSALCGQPVAGAVRFAGTAQIADLDALRQALRHAFVARGGRLHAERAHVAIAHGRADIPGLGADTVLVCAGVRAAPILRRLGHAVPMIAERGYHIRADARAWPADLPPVVFEQRAMIVTRYRDSVQAASFVELGDPDAPADPRKWERLERHVAELGLPMAGPFRRWMGCRPTLPDYLPAIGRSARASNLFYAFGHQHLGLTLAPATAHLITALIDKTAPAVSLAPFDLSRFG